MNESELNDLLGGIMDIQNSIIELSLLAWRGGYVSGKYGSDAAKSEKMKVKKLRDEILNEVTSEEERIRKRFHNIVNGEGPIIPRIAVKTALDDIFNVASPHDLNRYTS
jgi:hypothetical protein